MSDIVSKVWKEYQKGLGFNTQQLLDDAVRANENFFVGKQWEGVESNGLPTPVFNFIKQTVLFAIASIISNNVKINGSAFSTVVEPIKAERMANIINAELDRVAESNKLTDLIREFARNAAVDKDGCLFTYWDADAESGQAVKGAIVTEVVENTRVHFGNPNDRRVQKQPYIILSSREIVEDVQERAKENKTKNWKEITADTSDHYQDPENITDGKVAVLLKLWKDKKTGTIRAVETTQKAVVKDEWNMGLKLYPIVWLNWDIVQDNFHGRSMVDGLIPNQIFVNKLFAMSMISLMTTAYPKIIYNKLAVDHWDNRVGAAIPVKNGMDVNQVAKNLSGASIDPQVERFISMCVDMTRAFQGATGAALGEGKAYNTSAIIALQKAAAAPSELTKQNLYQAIEDLGRIYIDFMRENYGTRTIYAPIPKDMSEVAEFAEVTGDVPQIFDFAELKDAFFSIKLDVGASSYWSEMQAVATLDNMIQIFGPTGQMSLGDYLERLPRGVIPKQQEWIDNLKTQPALPPQQLAPAQ